MTPSHAFHHNLGLRGIDPPRQSAKIQAPWLTDWLTDRAQWVTAVRPMDAAGDAAAAASEVSAKRSLMPRQSAAFPPQNGPLMVCAAIPDWAGPGSVVLQSKPDEWMNGEEGRVRVEGGSAVSAAGIHRSITCKLITFSSMQRYHLSACRPPVHPRGCVVFIQLCLSVSFRDGFVRGHVCCLQDVTAWRDAWRSIRLCCWREATPLPSKLHPGNDRF